MHLKRVLGVSFVLVLAARPVPAVQASWSIAVFPEQPTLSTGATLHEVVRVFNTSTDTPPDGAQEVPARLSGTILLELACADPLCTTPLAGTLTFLDCSPSTGICCGLDPFDVTGNTVFLTMPGSPEPDGTVCPGAGGMTIAPGGSVALARVSAIAVYPTAGDGTFFSRALATSPNDLTACSSVAPTRCAMTEGSATLTFPWSSTAGAPRRQVPARPPR